MILTWYHLSEMKIITKHDKIYNIVKEYPDLKEILIRISPKFSKLNNSVVLETMGRVATVEKAAEMADIDVENLLGQLNNVVNKGLNKGEKNERKN